MERTEMDSILLKNCEQKGRKTATFISSTCVKSHTVIGSTRAICHTASRNTLFSGQALTRSSRVRTSVNKRNERTNGVTMVVDPWSVSPEAVDQIAAQLFAASLFPYLGFLYFLSKKETKCPPIANFGFRFLLAFVGATIPAGIYAKVAYNDILANVDWLHGSAESLLTLTNFIIVLGFRNVLANSALFKSANTSVDQSSTQQRSSISSQSPAISVGVAVALALASSSFHQEPLNALSFPTWIIHISSLFEWLAAMGLVWQFANVSGNQRWKGLVWGMLPLHTSGLCACTYHLFYNAPALNALVAIQAGLTCFGNATMALATYRIAKSLPEANSHEGGEEIEIASTDVQESNLSYFAKVFIASAVVSGFVKWGSLAVDWPFDPTWPVALSLIGVPTVLNIVKWAVRSNTSRQQFGGLL